MRKKYNSNYYKIKYSYPVTLQVSFIVSRLEKDKSV